MSLEEMTAPLPDYLTKYLEQVEDIEDQEDLRTEISERYQNGMDSLAIEAWETATSIEFIAANDLFIKSCVNPNYPEIFTEEVEHRKKIREQHIEKWKASPAYKEHAIFARNCFDKLLKFKIKNNPVLPKYRNTFIEIDNPTVWTKGYLDDIMTNTKKTNT